MRMYFPKGLPQPTRRKKEEVHKKQTCYCSDKNQPSTKYQLLVPTSSGGGYAFHLEERSGGRVGGREQRRGGKEEGSHNLRTP